MKRCFLSLLILSGFVTTAIAQTNTFPGRVTINGATDNASYALQARGSVSSIDASNQNTIFMVASPTRSYLATSYLGAGAYVPLSFEVAGVKVLNIETSGKVGIGIVDPAAQLHVESNSNNGIITKLVQTNTAASNGLFVQTQTTNPGDLTLNLASGGGNKGLMSVRNNGNIGMGISTPQSVLHLYTATAPQFKITNEATGSELTDGFRILMGDDLGVAITNKESGYLSFETAASEKMRILSNGNVCIGTTSSMEKLSVNGNIRAKKVIVQTAWSDYVFNDNYELRPLSELSRFIKTNKHLPEIPSAKEVEEKGVSVGDNQALLLKKIEELTLYILQQEERIKKLEKRMSEK